MKPQKDNSMSETAVYGCGGFEWSDLYPWPPGNEAEEAGLGLDHPGFNDVP